MQTGNLREARRYATELFKFARDNNGIEDTASGLATIVSTLGSSRELSAALHSPLLSNDKKSAILKGVFGHSISPALEQFLLLVVKKDDAIILPQIESEFRRLWDAHRGEADALVTSATPLSAQQIAALETALQARFGVKVRLQTRVDAAILGGLVVRVGDKLIDSSVATQLAAIRENLKRVKVT